MNQVSKIPKKDRKCDLPGGMFAAMANYNSSNGIISFILYYGEKKAEMIIFDFEKFEEHPTPLPNGAICHKTHVAINASSRTAVIEYVHRGAKNREVAYILKMLISAGNADKYELDLNPKIGGSFSQNIDSFISIHFADITMVRPNYDWEEWEGDLTGAAGDSNAHTVHVSMTASKGESIRKDDGIIAFLKKATSQVGLKSILENAKIVGLRAVDAAPFTLRLKRHILGKSIWAKMQRDGRVDSRDVSEKVISYLESLNKGDMP